MLAFDWDCAIIAWIEAKGSEESTEPVGHKGGDKQSIAWEPALKDLSG